MSRYSFDWLVPLAMLLAPAALELAEGDEPAPAPAASPPIALPSEAVEHDDQPAGDQTPRIAATRIASVSDLSSSPPAEGHFRIHLIDVGTGLSILVQGHDFTMLYDGGSGDDKSGITQQGDKSRLVAYLFAALGPSGPAACAPVGDAEWHGYGGTKRVTINHIVLSHPHDDHGSLLDDVLACYDVEDVWDAGVVNDTVFYRDFLQAVAAEPGVRFHTAAAIPDNRTYEVKGQAVEFGDEVVWTTFSDSTLQQLGEGATFLVLHADGEQHADPNDNSIVLRVELGGTSLLLMGDAESGPREPPASPPSGVEAYLLEHHRAEIDVDILQVGHHGSKTSSRLDFLNAVSPAWALIGAGPKKYSGVTLPDPEVLTAIEQVLSASGGSSESLLRTNSQDEGGCDIEDRIGRDDDSPGGCDNYLLETSP